MGRFYVAVERVAQYTGDYRRVEVRAEMPNGMTLFRHTLIIDHPDSPATDYQYMSAIARMFREMSIEAQQRETQ